MSKDRKEVRKEGRKEGRKDGRKEGIIVRHSLDPASVVAIDPMALSLYLGTLMLPLERKYTSNDQSRETTLSHDSSDDAGRLTLKTNYYLELRAARC